LYARAFVTVPGLLAFARFTVFQSGFVWHDLDWLYDVALLHKLRPLCNTPHPNKAVAQARHALRHEGAVGIGLKFRFGKLRFTRSRSNPPLRNTLGAAVTAGCRRNTGRLRNSTSTRASISSKEMGIDI
jgi:hypothetical protein